jgi:magnesium transporter
MNKMTKRKKIGLSPGSLIYTGESKEIKPVLQGVQYNIHTLKALSKQDCLNGQIHPDYLYWIDLRGIHDVALISEIGLQYSIDKLILEDVLDPGHRIKIEDYDAAMFAIIYSLNYKRGQHELKKEQIAIYFTKHFLISFQEDADDSFSIIHQRMKMELSRIRSRGTDYLFYALLDYIVDNYFLIVEELNTEIDLLEDKITQKNEDFSLDEFHTLRNTLLNFKRYVQALREELNQIKKLESNLINESSEHFIRDLQDNVHYILESIDNQRELLNGLREMLISKANLNMNKDMKWLAMVSTVSIPILFFTGVYGMNFKYMPELNWQYGYLFWWIGVSLVVMIMVIFLKRRKMF